MDAAGATVPIHEVAKGRRLLTMRTLPNSVIGLAFSPDGRRLVSMAYDQALKIWEVASGQTLGQPIKAERPFGYFHFSPDGKRLATRAQSGVARLWDAFTGLALSEPFEHEGPLTDLRFSPNGQYILTASQDGAVKVWEAQAAPPEAFTVKTTDIYPCACFDREGRHTRREHLGPAQFAKVMDTLGGGAAGQQILAAWIAKEKLRDALNLRARITGSTPCERDVRGRLASFYDWCAQNDDIPELLSRVAAGETTSWS